MNKRETNVTNWNILQWTTSLIMYA